MTLPQLHHRDQIFDDWQRTTEQALESGRHPLLALGMDRRLLYNMPLLLSLATWHHYRRDVAEPIMLTGGVDALWPVPLLYLATSSPGISDTQYTTPGDMPREEVNAATPEAIRRFPLQLSYAQLCYAQLCYGGADETTYLASLTTLAGERIQSGTLFAIDLPVAMQPILSAYTQPHAHAIWRMLPLTLLHESAVEATAPAVPAVEAAPAPTAVDPWLTWAALTLVVLLVVLALFL